MACKHPLATIGTLKRLPIFLCLIFVLQSSAFSQEASASGRRVLVVGSSLTAGWVSSHRDRHDFQNGFAQRLYRLLYQRGIEVIVSAEPGLDSEALLRQINREVVSQQPDRVLLVLSLDDEPWDKEDPKRTVERFKQNVRAILNRLEDLKLYTILADGTIHSSDQTHNLIEESRLWLNSLGYPLVNLSGALMDGMGRLPSDAMYDERHPLNRGHEALFYTIAPTLFGHDQTRTLPQRLPTWGLRLPKRSRRAALLSHIPQNMMQSFALVFMFRTQRDSPLAQVDSIHQSLKISCLQGTLLCQGSAEGVRSEQRIDDGAWHIVALSHHPLHELTELYLDGNPLGHLKGSFQPRQFLIAPKGARAISLRNIMIYRSPLTREMVRQIGNGTLLRGSLELFTPLDLPIDKQSAPVNLAPTDAVWTALRRDHKAELEAQDEQIRSNDTAKAAEPDFPEKKGLPLKAEDFVPYLGTYYITAQDALEVTELGERLVLVDQGKSQELFYEGNDRFFLKTPRISIEVLFTNPREGLQETLRLLYNGQLRLEAHRSRPPVWDAPVKKRNRR